MLVYMQADNDLRDYAFWDLAEMELGKIKDENDELTILVELDLPGNEGIERLKITGKKRDLKKINFSNFTRSSLSSKSYKHFKEEQFSQKERLLNFLIDSEEKFPTEKTILVIWGHGEGYSNSFLAQFGGVAIDQNPYSKLSIEGISEIFDTYKAIFNKNIDILVMDACLMQTIEVAMAFYQNTNFLIGSSQIEDFRGLPYDLVIEVLLKKVSSFEMAKQIPFLFEKRAKEETLSDNRTMSAVNLDELKSYLTFELEKLSQLLARVFIHDSFLAIELNIFLENLPFFLGENRDFSSLLAKLDQFFSGKNMYNIVYEIRNVRKVFQRVHLSYFYGENYVLNNNIDLGAFKAFGIWFPNSVDDFNSRFKQFENSAFYQLVPSWKAFLMSLYNLK